MTNRMPTAALLLILLFGFCMSAADLCARSGDPALRSLLETERAFARSSVEKGADAAFLAYLADESMIFRPHPVNGKPWIRSNPSPSLRLSWEPAYAEVSGAGDFGYTTGPWVASDTENPSRPSRTGHFVSLWKREGEGAWKVVLDAGVVHPPLAHDNLPWPSSRALKRVDQTSRTPVDSLRSTVLAADHALNTALRTQGTVAPMFHRSTADLKVYRRGHAPLMHPDTLRLILALDDPLLVRRATVCHLSSSADLAATVGVMENASGAPAGYYVRLWRCEGETWALALDLVTPSPPQASPARRE